MAIFSLFKYNQSNKIKVRIGYGTIKITTVVPVRAMLTSKKKYSGRARNKSGVNNKNRGAMPPAGDAPGLKVRVGCHDRLCVNSEADETLA